MFACTIALAAAILIAFKRYMQPKFMLPDTPAHELSPLAQSKLWMLDLNHPESASWHAAWAAIPDDPQEHWQWVYEECEKIKARIIELERAGALDDSHDLHEVKVVPRVKKTVVVVQEDDEGFDLGNAESFPLKMPTAIAVAADEDFENLDWGDA